MITDENASKMRGLFGVYKIISPSGKIYVGSGERYKQYKVLNCKLQTKLYNSLTKYGWAAHTFEVICIEERENLYCWENHFGVLYDVIKRGLNCKLPRCGDIKAVVSEETREKLRRANIGKKMSPEAIEKTRQGNLGRKNSQETKDRMSIIHQNRSPEYRENIAIAHRKKIIDTNTGIIYYGTRNVVHLYPQYSIGHLCSMLNGRKTNKTSLKIITKQ